MRAPTFPQLRLFSALLALVFLALPVALHAEGKPLKGVALVIGQSKYEHIPELANPANDAREMVKLLSDLGFDARSVSDRDAKKLKRDLERFVEDAEGADVAFSITPATASNPAARTGLCRSTPTSPRSITPRTRWSRCRP
jgi:hypothetical protein